MIGHLTGEVLFCDGNDLIIHTANGVGYQVYFNQLVAEGSEINIYISHIVRENAQDLYGFVGLKEKKLFELLTTVKGIGPKSAYMLLSSLGVEKIQTAITFEQPDVLAKAPGIGKKAASQIILDLKKKVDKVNIYFNSGTVQSSSLQNEVITENNSDILQEALLACKELGFKEDEVIPSLQKLMVENKLSRAEQLVHLVLKEF
ncbi:MAG: Holliday junction branch migration protein RuvA [Bacteriovoracaceae bacterium]